MLSQIRNSAAATTKGPVALLLGCHERIRHFTSMALRMAENPEVPPQEISSAAEAVLRYFSIALPLHEADEDESIFPRLHGAVPAGHLVAKSVEAMRSQHRAIDELLGRMVPLWQAVQSQPIELRDLALELKEMTTGLRLQFAAHLAMEEDIIFPAIQKLLSAAERDQIEAEMHTRRRTQAA